MDVLYRAERRSTKRTNVSRSSSTLTRMSHREAKMHSKCLLMQGLLCYVISNLYVLLFFYVHFHTVLFKFCVGYINLFVGIFISYYLLPRALKCWKSDTARFRKFPWFVLWLAISDNIDSSDVTLVADRSCWRVGTAHNEEFREHIFNFLNKGHLS